MYLIFFDSCKQLFIISSKNLLVRCQVDVEPSTEIHISILFIYSIDCDKKRKRKKKSLF